jgi:hypothetical protein
VIPVFKTGKEMRVRMNAVETRTPKMAARAR